MSGIAEWVQSNWKIETHIHEKQAATRSSIMVVGDEAFDGNGLLGPIRPTMMLRSFSRESLLPLFAVAL